MFLRAKKKCLELIDTIHEMIAILDKIADLNSAITDCLYALELILERLKKEEKLPVKSIEQLNSVKVELYNILNNIESINNKDINKVGNEVISLKLILNEEVIEKLNIVFLPYKVSMWDSMESVYKAAISDNDCIVKVVPIPYYQLTKSGEIPTYEGDNFSKDINIIHYSNYDIVKEEPDIIFIHNIYDQYNTLTRVYEEYFTTNLKSYTDMLVYLPYHISTFREEGIKYLAYNLPTIKNIDKVILVGEHVKKAAIRDGIPEDKLLVLGSPKFDKIVQEINNKENIPAIWQEKIKDKTVFTLNTGCLFFAQDPIFKLNLLSEILSITKIIENSVVIWRPHPLTKTSIMQYTPWLLEYYNVLTEEYIKNGFMYNNIILDEGDDYLPALQVADILISNDGSLLRAYLVTGKKVLYLHNDIPKNEDFLSESIIPSEGFYYFFSKENPWYEVVKKLALGEDSLEEKRKSIIREKYINTDGTCGEKVHRTIKKCLLDKYNKN